MTITQLRKAHQKDSARNVFTNYAEQLSTYTLNKYSKYALNDVDSARNMFTNYAEQLSTYTIIPHQAHRLISDSVAARKSAGQRADRAGRGTAGDSGGAEAGRSDPPKSKYGAC